MTNSSAFDNSIRREERSALHTELLRRLRQHGVTVSFDDALDSTLADLLSAIDGFERAVVAAGGDLFVDSTDSSAPERPEFVLPRPHKAEPAETYMRRVNGAARRLERGD